MQRLIGRIFKPCNNNAARENGGITIEFSLIFTVFIFLIFFIFEMCRYLAITSAVDLALARAARFAATQSASNTNYTEVFRKGLAEESWLWEGFIAVDKFTYSVKYCLNSAQLIADLCSTSDSDGKLLAIYRVAYQYQPIIYTGVIPGTDKLIDALTNSLSRQLIFVQEYERDATFKDN